MTSFAPGDLAATFDNATFAEDITALPVEPQPEPQLQPFRLSPTDDGWAVLRPELPKTWAHQPAAVAAAAAGVASSAAEKIGRAHV